MIKKSEMQRFREVMAREGYEVVRIEYAYHNDVGYAGYGEGKPLTRLEGWEECRVTLIDRREEDDEPKQVYFEPWIFAYNLAMWEACGFRSAPSADSPEYEEQMAKIKAWQEDGHPVPGKDDAHALYQLEVVA